MDLTRSIPRDAYGLNPPTLTDAHTALRRVFPGSDGEERWTMLLAAAGLTGAESDLDALQRLTQAMTASREPVIVLCARSLTIRLTSYQHLSATHQLVTGAHQ